MASLSAVSICNVALAQLGAEPIHDLLDEDKQAIACNIFYEQARISCLARHPWNFAIRRVELAQDVDAPIKDFSHSYTLPADCLRVLGVISDGNYKVEGRKVLTNSPTCFLRFIADVIDTSVWSPGFVDYLTARLRLDLAYVVTKDGNQISAAKTLLELAFSAAKGVDSSEDFPDDIGQFDSSLIAVRF